METQRKEHLVLVGQLGERFTDTAPSWMDGLEMSMGV
jgi:hypothetical protein